MYQSIAIEIGRALNFYGFNNPDAVIEVAYCCGGGLLLDPLVEAVAAHAEGRALPAQYWIFARRWERLGYPAFAAMVVVYFLMVFKPV